MSDETLDGRPLPGGIQASQARALSTVRRTTETVRRTIAANVELAGHPDHRTSAEQRIVEGRAELAQLAEEEARLVEAIATGTVAAPARDSTLGRIASVTGRAEPPLNAEDPPGGGR